MLKELQVTTARNSFKELYDGVFHRYLPAVVTRKQTEEVLLMRRDLQQHILEAYTLKPENLAEDDGSITLALNELELFVNANSLSEAIDELVLEIKTYSEDYRDRIELFLNAPNRKGHFPYVLRVWLCDNDQQIKDLLGLDDGS